MRQLWREWDERLVSARESLTQTEAKNTHLIKDAQSFREKILKVGGGISLVCVTVIDNLH